MTTTLDVLIVPIRSLSVCKSHLFPFVFVSTTVFSLYINICSLTQSGPNYRRQARKKGKDEARKEAKGPKVKVSFRRVRSFLLYSPLTRSPRQARIEAPSLLFIPSTVTIPTPMHSCEKKNKGAFLCEPFTFNLVTLCDKAIHIVLPSSCSPYVRHGCVSNESSTQFGSHFARLLSFDSSPMHSHSTSRECPLHSSLCVFLWYAPFLFGLCVSMLQISG